MPILLYADLIEGGEYITISPTTLIRIDQSNPRL